MGPFYERSKDHKPVKNRTLTSVDTGKRYRRDTVDVERIVETGTVARDSGPQERERLPYTVSLNPTLAREIAELLVRNFVRYDEKSLIGEFVSAVQFQTGKL